MKSYGSSSRLTFGEEGETPPGRAIPGSVMDIDRAGA
jgi:hypothetical protein